MRGAGVTGVFLRRGAKNPTPKTRSSERTLPRTPWPLYYKTPPWAHRHKNFLGNLSRCGCSVRTTLALSSMTGSLYKANLGGGGGVTHSLSLYISFFLSIHIYIYTIYFFLFLFFLSLNLYVSPSLSLSFSLSRPMSPSLSLSLSLSISLSLSLSLSLCLSVDLPGLQRTFLRRVSPGWQAFKCSQVCCIAVQFSPLTFLGFNKACSSDPCPRHISQWDVRKKDEMYVVQIGDEQGVNNLMCSWCAESREPGTLVWLKCTTDCRSFLTIHP